MKKEIKTVIEQLSDDEALDLLRQKWIKPLNQAMLALPHSMLAQFSQKLTALCDKYAQTYQQISERKQHSATQLAEMMNELTGDDFDMQGIHAWQASLMGVKHG